MSDSAELAVGDLVRLRTSESNYIGAHILWAGPDYDTRSLDVDAIINQDQLLVIVTVGDEDNVRVMTEDGILGWARASLLIKV